MTAILSTKELDKETKVKKTVKNDAYNEVLKECYAKIKTRNKLGYKSIMYKVRSILFGYPLYDINDLATFIIRKLQKGGFTVYIVQGSLLISWEKQKQQQQQQPQKTPVQLVSKEKKKVQFHDTEQTSSSSSGKLCRKEIEKMIGEYKKRF
jgi:hypothetical protein